MPSLFLTLMIMSTQQLDKKDFYKKLSIDPTKINRAKVNRTINELKSSHLLDEKFQMTC